jgi:hypothetical protein
MTIQKPKLTAADKRRQANIRRAVANIGGEKATASHFKNSRGDKLTFQAVQHWIFKARVPPVHIIRLERLSGVTRHELDEDIYPETLPCTAPKPVLSVRKKKPDSRAAR